MSNTKLKVQLDSIYIPIVSDLLLYLMVAFQVIIIATNSDIYVAIPIFILNLGLLFTCLVLPERSNYIRTTTGFKFVYSFTLLTTILFLLYQLFSQLLGGDNLFLLIIFYLCFSWIIMFMLLVNTD